MRFGKVLRRQKTFEEKRTVVSEGKQFAILIVDDEKMNLDVLNHILRPDYRVYIAKSGESALKKAKENHPNLILLDIIMPEMNGYEVIQKLKEEPETQDIPVIFITGLSNASSEEKGFELGAVDYIAKPFSPAVVRARVETQRKIFECVRQAEELGMFDSLTALPNHKLFEKQIHTECLRSARENTPLTLLLLEINRIETEDNISPVEEEMVVKSVSTTLRNVLKKESLLTYSLEKRKFGIVLSNFDLQETIELAEQIREALVSTFSEIVPCRTVSMGIATFSSMNDSQKASLYDVAREQLEKAKLQTGNCICS